MTVSVVEILAGMKTAGGFYSQLGNADPSINTDLISTIAAGDTHPRFLAANGSREEIPFETAQLATLLTEVGLFGADAGPVDLFYRKVSSLSGRVAAATTEHTRLRATEALMYLMSISAGHRGEASARGRVVPVYDGTNATLLRTGSLAITDTPTTAEAYVLGPISVQATKLQGCDSLEVNLNPSPWELSDESDESTTFAAINTIAPVISFTTTDVTALSYHKTALTPSNIFRAHLIRKKRGEARYLDNETQHIRFESQQGMILVQALSGMSPRSFRVEVHCSGVDSGNFSDVPLTVSTAVAIALPA